MAYGLEVISIQGDFDVYMNDRFLLIDKEFGITRFSEKVTRTSMNLHYHEFIEICLVASGHGFHVINGETSPVGYGDVFIIDTNTWHGFYCDDLDHAPITYNLMFKPEYIDQQFTGIKDIEVLSSSYLFNKTWKNRMISSVAFRPNPSERLELIDLSERIFKEFSDRLPAYEDLIRAYLIELIIKISRTDEANRQVVYHDKKSNTVAFIQKYVRENFSQKINLDDLADRTHYTKTHLCSIFKEYTGLTIYNFVQNIRIQNSIMLMMNDEDVKLTEISSICGFTDYKAFSTQFYEKTGFKPNEYRKLKPKDPSSQAL